MKKASCVIMLLLSFFACPNYSKQHAAITRLTNNIHQRLYVITRLEPPMSLIQSSSQANKRLFHSTRLDQIYEIEDVLFQHPLIQNCVESLKHKKNLLNFNKLWNQLQAYKYLDDQLLVDEFIQLLCHLVKNILYESFPLDAKDRNILNTASTNAFRFSQEYKLEFMTLSVEQFRRYEQGKQFDRKPFQIFIRSLKPSRADQKVSLNSNKIFKRFYHVKRLSKPISLLLNYQCPHRSYFHKTNASAAHFDQKLTFVNEKIKNCIAKMEESESIEPLELLLQGFKQFRCIDDTQFLREVLMMLFAAYKNLLVNELSKRSRCQVESSLTKIQNLYDNIASLPAEEMLTAIDNLTEELELLIHSANQSKLRKFVHTLQDKYKYLMPAIAGAIGAYCATSSINSSP